MLLIVGVFIYLKLPIIISGKNWMSFAPWMVFIIGIVVSSFLSKDIYISRNPLLAAIVALGGLLEFIAVINYAFKKKSYTDSVERLLYNCINYFAVYGYCGLFDGCVSYWK